MNPPACTFRALLEPGGPSFMPMMVALVPPEVVEALGGKAVRRVVGTLNGHAIRLGLQPLRSGERYLMINKQLQKTAGVALGQHVTIALAPDPAPEAIDLPAELAEGLATWPEAEARFQQLTPSMKRALARHVGSATRPETRAARTVRALHLMAAGCNPFGPSSRGFEG